MSSLIPEQLLLLDRVAELRAGGTSWAAIATELKLADDELHTLRAAHARAYDRLVRRAEREFQRETVRATLARLRELMKSSDEGVAMLAAGTVIRYELARMRNDLEVARDSFRKRQRQLFDEFTSPRKRPRDEFPPPPGLSTQDSALSTSRKPPPSTAVTAGKGGCDSGRDSPSNKPEPPKPQRVPTEAVPTKSQRCDSTAVPPTPSVTASRPAPPRPEMKPPLVGLSRAMPPSSGKGKTARLDAIRLKKWLPHGLAP